MRTGRTDLPLHGGKAPRWLFARMTKLSTYERQPEGFEQLLGMPGVGAKTVRALALISDLVYGKPPSWRDPARFAFAHGGMDGHPFPVDRPTYDRSIEILRRSLERARIEPSDKRRAFGKLDVLRRESRSDGGPSLRPSTPPGK